MFPLNAVVFPGLHLPLHVFEDRYRALVHDLLQIESPADRLFGSVAIREGYEVGDHGAQSLYRVGVVLQLTEAEPREDGSFDIVAVARERLVLDRLEPGERDYPVGTVTLRSEQDEEVPEEVLERARATFVAYRAALAEIQEDPYSGTLPRDPAYLSWTLAACAPLPMPDRQALLEADDAEHRLRLVTGLLTDELRAMNVIPSLPASDVARTRWSPN